jgi:glycosyltransferase involved in cell wall biosynthesis
LSDPSVSVALCTYQGEQYLQEQLDSIAGQSRLPDELVVCDDRSTDGTLGILDRFRSQAPFPVRVHVNDKWVGPAKNFEGAIERCDGDLVFLSDQDDVWHHEKLSILVPILLARPEAGAVFCDAEVVDERLRPLGYSLWEFLRFQRRLQKKVVRGETLAVLLRHNVMLGMTVGFKARFRDLILPIPADSPYDVWIPILIAAVAEVIMVPRRLSKYRQHEGQVVGAMKRNLQEMAAVKRRRTAEDFLQTANQYAAAHERLAALTATYACSSSALRQLQRKTGHLRARAEMRSGNGRVRLITREALAFNYRRFSSGWRSFAVDVLFSKTA